VIEIPRGEEAAEVAKKLRVGDLLEHIEVHLRYGIPP
jgi:hypothetical protein